MKRTLLIAAIAAIGLSSGAMADDVGVGVGVGPVGAGVTVGSGPTHVHRDRTTVIKEREPRDKTVIIHKHRNPPDRKVIIHDDD